MNLTSGKDYQLIVVYWCHIMTRSWVIVGLANNLLPDSAKCRQVIAWTDADLTFVKFCGIYLRGISQWVPMLLLCMLSLKNSEQFILFEAEFRLKTDNKWQTTYIWMDCLFPYTSNYIVTIFEISILLFNSIKGNNSSPSINHVKYFSQPIVCYHS